MQGFRALIRHFIVSYSLKGLPRHSSGRSVSASQAPPSLGRIIGIGSRLIELLLGEAFHLGHVCAAQDRVF